MICTVYNNNIYDIYSDIDLACGRFGTEGAEHLVSVHTGCTQALHPLCCLHPPPLDVLLQPPPLLLGVTSQTPD